MQIRVSGTRPEITDALFRLRDTFIVAEVSRLYPDRLRRGRYRVYADIYQPSS